jgi:hypothetical protein
MSYENHCKDERACKWTLNHNSDDDNHGENILEKFLVNDVFFFTSLYIV